MYPGPNRSVVTHASMGETFSASAAARRSLVRPWQLRSTTWAAVDVLFEQSEPSRTHGLVEGGSHRGGGWRTT